MPIFFYLLAPLFDLPTAGSWPDWFAAFGTVGTLGFVVVGLLRDRRKQREQELQQSRDRRDSEVGPARLVTSHLEWRYIWPERDHEEGFWYAEVAVDNDSSGPIHDLHVEPVPVVPAQAELLGEQTFPPGGYGEIAYLHAKVKRVRPEEPIKLAIFVEHALKMPVDIKGAAAAATFESFREILTRCYEVKMTFTDAGGLRWYRLGSFQPARVISPRS